MAKRTIVSIAAELCGKYPKSTKMAIARRLVNEVGCSFSHARSAIATVTGANGDSLRKYKRVDHRSCPMPPSAAHAWLPFAIKGDHKILTIADLHAPFHEEGALEAATDEGKRQKCDTVLINGDFGDFYRGSRFTQDPTSRYPFLLQEIDGQRKLLRWLRKKFPKQRFIFKKGNHDERWDHYLWSHAPELGEMPELRLEHVLGLADLDIEIVGDKRVILAGKLPVWHGHELPKGIASPVNPARGLFAKTGTTGLQSHCHQTSGHGESNWRKDEVFCYSTGCLCFINPEYAPVNKWNWGAAVISTKKSGEFNVMNFRINKNYQVHC